MFSLTQLSPSCVPVVIDKMYCLFLSDSVTSSLEMDDSVLYYPMNGCNADTSENEGGMWQ